MLESGNFMLFFCVLIAIANINPREINSEIQFSQLPLNGHLSKTDTWCWSLPFFSHFTVTILPIRRTTGTFETINGQFGGSLCSEK